MKCDVCGRSTPEVKRHFTAGGDTFGTACPECVGLAWEAYFVRKTGDAYDSSLIAWEWRKRRAEVNGTIFIEPPPQSPGERATVSLEFASLRGVS